MKFRGAKAPALHCIAKHCIAKHCIAKHCKTKHCIAKHCEALHCEALHCEALHYEALHCDASHCETLHYEAALYGEALHCKTEKLILGFISENQNVVNSHFAVPPKCIPKSQKTVYFIASSPECLNGIIQLFWYQHPGLCR